MQLQSTCSVHHPKLAIVQCLSRVKLKVPMKESYHCSRKCFLDSWQDYLILHRCASHTMCEISKVEEEAGQKIKSFGSWPNLTALHEHKGVVHREGIQWVKIGHVKKYGDTIFCGQTPKAKNFSVLSYSILSDLYTSNYRYAYCPSWTCSREHIADKICFLRSQVMGWIFFVFWRSMESYGIQQNKFIWLPLMVEQVQSDHFENFFKPELEKHSYSGIYKKKKKEVEYDKSASSIVELLESA